MPEERKPSVVGPTETTTENGTSSPSKSPLSKGKLALAKVTLLDGTVKDFNIEVIALHSIFFNDEISNFNFSEIIFLTNSTRFAEKGERLRAFG